MCVFVGSLLLLWLLLLVVIVSCLFHSWAYWQTLTEIHNEATLLPTSGIQEASKPPPPFAIERQVWLALYEAARLSIKHGTAIVLKSPFVQSAKK